MDYIIIDITDKTNAIEINRLICVFSSYNHTDFIYAIRISRLLIRVVWLPEHVTTTFSNQNFWAWESSLWAPGNNTTILRQKINSINLIIGINF